MIFAKWASLRWEAGILGYPLTDELTTPDGVGRFNHSRALPAAALDEKRKSGVVPSALSSKVNWP